MLDQLPHSRGQRARKACVRTKVMIWRSSDTGRHPASPAASVACLPPSCRHACALAAARAPSSRSSCCRWCCPSLAHLGNCGHKLAVQSGLPTSPECMCGRTKEESESKESTSQIKTSSSYINKEETKTGEKMFHYKF